MADSVEFILKLNDQVSGAAKQAAASVRSVEERAKAAADKGMAKLEAATRRMGVAQSMAAQMNAKFDAQRVRSSEKAIAAAQKASAVAQKEAAKQAALAKGNSFFGGFGQKLGFRSVADYAKGAFIGDLAAKGVETIIGGFVSGAKAAVNLVASGVKMAFSEGGKAEDLRLSYKLLLGESGGRKALDDIGGFAGKTKYDDDDIATMMRPLFGAGLRGQGARSVFAASGDLEAAGLGSAQEFVESFAKIQLKGGVTEKLLVGMGVNIRDFKQALAGSTDKTKQETAFKKASEGKTDPQKIMNAIFQGIEKRQGGMLGSGMEQASKTMSARLHKLENLPSQFLKKMSESDDWQKLSDKFGDVLLQLDPDSARGQKIVGSLFKTFNRVADAINEALAPENLDGFVKAMQVVVQDVATIVQGLQSAIHFAAHPIDATKEHLMGVLGGGDNAKSTALDLMRSAGTISDENLKAAIAGMTPEEQAALSKRGADNDYDYQKLVPGMAASVTRSNDNGKAGANVSFNGDINVTAGPNADAKDTASEVVKRLTREMHKGLERAAIEGGG